MLLESIQKIMSVSQLRLKISLRMPVPGDTSALTDCVRVLRRAIDGLTDAFMLISLAVVLRGWSSGSLSGSFAARSIFSLL